MSPSFITGALKSGWLYFVGMILITSAYWQSAFIKVFDFAGGQGEMAHFGLNPPAFFAAGTIIIQLGASALMIFGKRLAWLGAGILGVFTLATIPIAHAFWKFQGQEAFTERMFTNANLTIVGGLILAAIAAELKYGPSR
ncbi:MAG: DoxX family protein [Pseudomonadota bacterium]|jgi:transmembrane protein|nr:DoxX family protein [Pseudomonadota bacterium]